MRQIRVDAQPPLLQPLLSFPARPGGVSRVSPMPLPHFNFFSQTHSATECNSTHAHTARHDANITAPPTQPELAHCENISATKTQTRPSVVRCTRQTRANSAATLTRDGSTPPPLFIFGKVPTDRNTAAEKMTSRARDCSLTQTLSFQYSHVSNPLPDTAHATNRCIREQQCAFLTFEVSSSQK